MEPKDSGHESERPKSIFIDNPDILSSEARIRLESASRCIEESDPSTDNLGDVISSLEEAKQQLEDINKKPGVASEKVEDTIDQIDSKLDSLLEIRSTYADVKRKLSLSKGGMETLGPSFEELYSSVDDAIAVAEDLGRSTEQLEKYHRRLADKIDSSHGETPAQDRSNSSEINQHTSNSGSNTDGSSRYSSDDQNSSRFKFGNIENSSSDSTNSKKTNTSESKDPRRQDLITELTRLKDQVGCVPESVDILKYGKYKPQKFTDEFGSLEDAISEVFPQVDQKQGRSEQPSSQYQNNIPLGDGFLSDSGGDTQDTDQVDENIDESSTSRKEEIINELNRVAESIQKRPTTSEFESHSELNTSDVYSFFDSWRDAIKASGIEIPSRQELLRELQDLERELGHPPRSNHIGDQSDFSPYDYQREFGSFDNALESAGIDIESNVRLTIKKAIAINSGEPTMADFEKYSPYSSGVIYKYFDSWDDAVSSVKQTDSDSVDSSDTDSSDSDSVSVEQNELSEQYELLRNLRILCKAVVSARDQFSDECGSGCDQSSDPMVLWADNIEEFWHNGPSTANCYGEQQREKNPFSMKIYREQFGDGEFVTKFEFTTVQKPSLTVQAMLNSIIEIDPNRCFLPVDSETGATFPVIVETDDELQRAIDMLNRLPVNPRAVTSGEDTKTSNSENTESISECDVGCKTTEIRDVNGVSDAISDSLLAAGYSTREHLKDATVDELADVNNVSRQIALRIKLDVGE